MTINENRVREFAHQIWESEGKPHGQDQRHWEMACRLAEEAEESNPQQQQASSENTAPQHQTVARNDTDIINKPGKEKAKALKKTIDETKTKPKGKKAKLLKDVVETELSPIESEIQPI